MPDKTVVSKDDKRARTQRGRQDRVCEAMGIRQTCLAILAVSKAQRVVEECYRLGRLADEVALANDGYLFASFDEVAKKAMER